MSDRTTTRVQALYRVFRTMALARLSNYLGNCHLKVPSALGRLRILCPDLNCVARTLLRRVMGLTYLFRVLLHSYASGREGRLRYNRISGPVIVDLVLKVFLRTGTQGVLSRVYGYLGLGLGCSKFPRAADLFRVPKILEVGPDFFLTFQRGLRAGPFFIPGGVTIGGNEGPGGQ